MSDTLPEFVDYGGQATAPAPFRCEGGEALALLLRGDRDKIAELVRRTLDVPAGDEAHYQAFSDKLLLMIGRFERVRSMTPPFDRYGAVTEVQASFFVPVLGGTRADGEFAMDRLCVMIPFLFLDNSISCFGGREAFGYAKTLGRFDPRTGLGDRVTLHAYGGNYGKDAIAGWHRLLEVRSTGARTAAPAQPERAGEAAGMPLELLVFKPNQVFLKQFRDAQDGTRACYQAIVEAPMTVRSVSAKDSTDGWHVTIDEFDSHPIGRELGVYSQDAELALKLKLDFDVEPGVVVAAPMRAATGSLM